MPTRVDPARPGDPGRIGPYRIIGRLGSGGMGTVHAALDPEGLRVAIKIIHPAQADDDEFRARFRREVGLSWRVAGPCLVPLLAADTDAATPWLATEYVPGPTLGQHIAMDGPLTGARLYALAAGTAAALAAVHKAGVVHRDVKPANVILAPSGPRVLDFGIAHALDGTSVTRTGVMTGTAGWISPEYYRTGTAGPAGDVFAWGALVAYAATGRLPFGTGAPDVVAFRVMSGNPDIAGVPDDLLALVRSALAKEPDDRPTAATLAEECTALLASQATHVLAPCTDTPTLVGDLVAAQWDMAAPDDTAWTLAQRRTSRRRIGLLATAGVTSFAIAAGGGYAFVGQAPFDKRPSVSGSVSASTAVASPSGNHSAAPTQTSSAAGTPASATTPLTAKGKAEPKPAYTRTDDAQPTIQEWAGARDSMTPAEYDIASTINRELGKFLREQYALNDGAQVTFSPQAQTMFVTVGPSSVVYDNGGDYTELIRSVMFAGCSYGNEKLRTNYNWPYGRVVAVYRESMATPIIADYRDATNSMRCRV